MAKNYTFAETVEIINAGTDMESITDIGRRFPTLLYKVTKVATKAGEDFVDLMSFMPDYLTANKVNSALKAAVGETTEAEDATDADAEETTETKTTKATKKEEATEEKDTGETDYESMSGKQLWDILGKAGLRKTAKSTKKADLVAACKAMDAAKTGATEDEAEEAETEEATETNPYDGKSAMELFKECKARGIKAEAKKPAKFYADLLVKDDATKATEETESESDDWDEDEEKEEPKAKTSKKAEKKETKKTAKKEEADDDDDWDI
jgi:hypothetical protein